MSKYFSLSVQFSFLALFLLSFASVSAQFNVVPFSKGQIAPETDGVFYFLPRNTVVVEIEVIKTETFKGPYADYAGKYLGLTKVNNENSTKYSLGQVNTRLQAEPDPAQLYFISLDPKAAKGKSLSISLTNHGIISGFAMKNLAGDESPRLHTEKGNYGTLLFKDLYQPSLTEKIDTIIRKISIDTTTIEERIVKRSITEKSADQTAKEIADAIRKIDENIFNLTTGYQEVNYSKESLQFMISELRKTQNEYLALFIGKQRVSSVVHTFYITPQGSDELLESLCKFSTASGILPKNAGTGENINLTLSKIEDNSALTTFVKQREQPQKKSRGLYYRIPQQVKVNVSAGVNILLQKNELIPQFGEVTYLPAGNFDHVVFSPTTGSVLSISIK